LAFLSLLILERSIFSNLVALLLDLSRYSTELRNYTIPAFLFLTASGSFRLSSPLEIKSQISYLKELSPRSFLLGLVRMGLGSSLFK